MNRAESKYAGLYDLKHPGCVEVVTIERRTVSCMSGSPTRRRTRPVKRWYLVLACRAGKTTWYGKLACPARVAKAVRKGMYGS